MRIFSLCRNRTYACSLITASRTLATNKFQPSLRTFPLKQHRFMSQESAANVDEEKPVPAFQGGQPRFSKPRESFERQEFPSAKGPLNSQTWRQFLTSDEKTIVCVHPAKSVPIQDTKVLQIMLKSSSCRNLLSGERDHQTILYVLAPCVLSCLHYSTTKGLSFELPGGSMSPWHGIVLLTFPGPLLNTLSLTLPSETFLMKRFCFISFLSAPKTIEAVGRAAANSTERG